MRYEFREILRDLKAKYNTKLNQSLVSVKIAQSTTEVLLISQERDKEIFIENLNVLVDDDLIELMDVLPIDLFKPIYSIEENVSIFINELNETDLANCFSKLIFL